ncbi:MAG TPA: TolC family protein [Candidatus Aminicenantes bacterium]|nr:TolC family protein [Candidatus Aminicenantes bacterium]
MAKKIKLVPLIIILSLIICGEGLAQERQTLLLSLDDCIRHALENNLQLAIEVYNPEIAEAQLVQAREMFLPQFDLSFGSRNTEEPSYWWIQGAETIKSDLNQYSIAVRQKIPTGGNFTLSLNSYRSSTNQAFQLINPRYGSTLQVDFTQPLLRGFGYKISRKEIIIAQNNLDISEKQFKAVLLETIYKVEEVYWNLVYAEEDYQVKLDSLKLAQASLEKTQKEAKLGKIAPIEVLNAQATVAQREAELLQAEALVAQREDALRDILNLPEEDKLPPCLKPKDRPRFEPQEIPLEEAIQQALLKRPELQSQQKLIESNRLNFSFARNQLLPGLDLNISYWSPGVSGDRLLYLNDNPFLGIIVGKEKGSASDSLKDAFNLKYKNWAVSLTLSLPLSNVLTRAEYVRNRLELEKSQLALKELERQIRLEVKNAVREIKSAAKKVEAFRTAREWAEKRLKAEERKLQLGLTTNFFVFQYQSELAAARSQELKSIVDYEIAWAKLEKAMGISLEKKNIRLPRFSQ